MSGSDVVQALEPRLLFASSAPFSHAALSLPLTFTPGGTAVVGDTAIFAGGDVDPIGDNREINTVYFYNAAKHKWSTSQLPRARDSMGATAVGDEALFAGGEVDRHQIISDAVDIYRAHTHRWTTAKLSVPRADVAATSVGRLAIFAGGISSSDANGAGQTSDVVDFYDTKYARWTMAHLSAAGQYVTTSVGKYALFVTSAAASTKDNTPGTVDIYNAKTNTWATAQLPAPAEEAVSVGEYALFVQLDGTVNIFNSDNGAWITAHIAAGGPVGAASVGNDALLPAFGGTMSVFNASTAQWSTFDTGLANRDFDSAFTVGGTAYFSGGLNHDGEQVHPTKSIEAYTLM